MLAARLMRMDKLTTLIPDIEVLLGLSTEELASTVLRLAAQRRQNGLIHASHMTSDLQESYGNPCPYPANRRQEALFALGEAWNWLCVQGLLVAEMDSNGSNGWLRLSRRAQQLLDETAFKKYAGSLEFPKALLHPSIREDVWLDIVRGDPGTAVFKAFRAVEVAVRTACKFPDNEIGVVMMRKAFDPKNGPLSDMSQPEGERESRAHLFAGAIGSFKNPISHREVTIEDIRVAQEQVMLASHLLRIVDGLAKG